MKRFIAFLSVVMLASCLVACGNKASTTPVGSQGGASGDEAVEKNDSKVFIPDDSYVIYKEYSTKTGVELFYEYNDRGHVTKIAHTYTDGHVEDEIYDYTYNADGSYSFHKTGWGSEYIKKFDAKGRLTEQINDPDTKRAVTNTYTYVSDTVVDFESRANDNSVRSKNRNYYDDNGLLVKAEHFLANGVLYAYTVYSYDKYGNETTHTAYTPEGEINSNNAVYEWEQVYDEHGRIIRKTQGLPTTGGKKHEEIYEYNDEARTYTVTMTTGYTVYEYRPLADCIN